MLNHGRHHPELGASSIIVAGTLILLLGITAIALDLGSVFNEDRQDQTAADVAVLAGAIEYAVPNSPEGTVTSVLRFVRQNLTTTYSDADWETLWSTCTDAGRPATFNPAPAPSGWVAASLDCISGSSDELRVRVPDQIVQANFGRVVGVDSISTRAEAQARLQNRTGAGGVRPFGILDGLAAGNTCLTTSPGGHAAPPCDGPDSGNFGTLNSQTWGNGDLGTTIDCGTPGNEELQQNIALGIDHPIGLARSFPGAGAPYTSFPAAVVRNDECAVSGGEAVATDNSPRIGPVNAMLPDTGFNLFKATKIGLISGVPADFTNTTATVEPLLQQPSGPVGSRRDLKERISNTTYTYDLDNTPLWMHLRDWSALQAAHTGAGLGPLCSRTVIAAAPNPSDAMGACLAAYEVALPLHPTLGPLFDDSLGSNPRFGWVPQFHFTTWGSGASDWQPVKRYRMIYLDTIWFNCNGKYDPNKNDEGCDGAKGLVFRPAGTADESDMQVGNGNSMKQLRLDQISAFLLPDEAVSEKVAATFPGGYRGPFEVVLTR